MSLKAFHVFFVVVSTACAVVLAVWAFVRGQPLLGAGSVVAAGALVWYGLWFLRKLKGVSYL